MVLRSPSLCRPSPSKYLSLKGIALLAKRGRTKVDHEAQSSSWKVTQRSNLPCRRVKTSNWAAASASTKICQSRPSQNHCRTKLRKISKRAYYKRRRHLRCKSKCLKRWVGPRTKTWQQVWALTPQVKSNKLEMIIWWVHVLSTWRHTWQRLWLPPRNRLFQFPAQAHSICPLMPLSNKKCPKTSSLKTLMISSQTAHPISIVADKSRPIGTSSSCSTMIRITSKGHNNSCRKWAILSQDQASNHRPKR